MRLNLQKTKHIYILYGLLNSLMIVGVLVVTLFLYNKFSKFDNYDSLINGELNKLYQYKSISNETAISKIFDKNLIEEGNDTQKDEIINELMSSRLQIIDLYEEHLISDLRFEENTYSLTIDYDDLITKNQLLYKYTTELGNKEQGLYYKLKTAATDFNKKLKEYNVKSELVEEFNYLMSTIDLFLYSRNKELAKIIEIQLKRIGFGINSYANQGDYLVVRLNDSYSNFETSYYEFAKKTLEIGLTANDGLRSKINTSYLKIDIRLRRLVEIIAKEKKETEQSVFSLTAIFILIVFAINLLTARFFVRSTNNVIERLIEHLKLLGTGTFLKFKKSDFPIETHKLLASLEAFSDKLINSIKVAEVLATGKTTSKTKKEDQLEVFYSNYEKIKQIIDKLNQGIREDRKKQANMLWIKSGIDKLTNVMRQEYDNPLLHASEVINMLVKFLNVPIGAIYSVKEENGQHYVEMMASFAYGKEKQLYQKIAMGEGIVGTAASEKKTLNLTNIPEGYFKIISGFGEARPKNILVSPIKLNEEIYGVFELASLTRFKQEEIDFVEEVCKTVAYSFAISKVYLDTLYKFEEVNMEVAQLESENASLTNDYEELSNSYKMMMEKGADNSFVVEKINEIALIVDLDLDANILEANQGFENFFKAAKLKVLHSNFKDYMTEINLSEDFNIESIWRDVRAGIQHYIEQKVIFSGKDYFLNQHFLPIKDEMGRVKKVKVIAFEIEDKVEMDNEITRK